MYKFPLIELLDRYCIATLKSQKIGGNDEELEFYTNQLKDFDIGLVRQELDELTEIHSKIWDMEDDFKRFTVEKKYSLEEVGRRAIAVRDTNALRYSLKNRIAEKLNDPVREMKQYG